MQRTIATRVPRELEEAIIEFMREEGLDKSTAIRRILEMGVKEWRRKKAIGLYRDGKVTLWRAARSLVFRLGR